MEFKRTRIAPTPSGFLHLGNVFSFSLTVALARRMGAAILLRIDDLDRGRVQREYVQDIFDTLRFLDIPWDEGPTDFSELEREWSQVHRLPLYQAALERLRDFPALRSTVDTGAGFLPGPAVFGCVCSRAQVMRMSFDAGYPGTCETRGVSLDAPEVSWRLRTAALQNQDSAVSKSSALAVSQSYASAGSQSRALPLPVEMRDFVVRKKDGYPAYQLSSLVDDRHYDVDLIVRGQDLWASTLAQYYLSYFLDAGGMDAGAFREAQFFHHPLLTGSAGEKLSKSAGATSIRYLRQQGLTREDIYALIARSLGVGASAPGQSGHSTPGHSGHSTPGRSGYSEPIRSWEELAALVEIKASRLQG